MKLNLMIISNSDVKKTLKTYDSFFNIKLLKEKDIPEKILNFTDECKKFDIIIMDDKIKFESNILKKLNNMNHVVYFFNYSKNNNIDRQERRTFKALSSSFMHILNQWLES